MFIITINHQLLIIIVHFNSCYRTVPYHFSVTIEFPRQSVNENTVRHTESSNTLIALLVLAMQVLESSSYPADDLFLIFRIGFRDFIEIVS
jgi:hypothetical protein